MIFTGDPASDKHPSAPTIRVPINAEHGGDALEHVPRAPAIPRPIPRVDSPGQLAAVRASAHPPAWLEALDEMRTELLEKIAATRQETSRASRSNLAQDATIAELVVASQELRSELSTMTATAKKVDASAVLADKSAGKVEDATTSFSADLARFKKSSRTTQLFMILMLLMGLARMAADFFGIGRP